MPDGTAQVSGMSGRKYLPDLRLLDLSINNNL
jgi:hypothetical protein